MKKIDIDGMFKQKAEKDKKNAKVKQIPKKTAVKEASSKKAPAKK